ncbi:uncharacterized protein UMAG_15091 [Mycosarcoma maydis]|uniref:BHLH domain-containing protein n=1 Tax=Mycosarcoma maydis TaxID=5270 RepID=A0A0D1CSA7_MYCMD|nr:uncharacterized protein UMAG_15091 [Ustilago maydis 521]KIS69418.1 hypothetical protein UMAG_15091 [Ustilago maydis 521]|eukprot:XP_011389259.1 hypothetical protein UMAG_15091 [Ustilago maydis 521]
MKHSPASSNNPFTSSSTPNSFMDTFDFGNPDFSTANSGLEDLDIFHSTGAPPSGSSQRNLHSDAGSAPVSHHPSPSAAFNHTAASSDSNTTPQNSSLNGHGSGVYLNSASHANSPLGFSRNRFDNNSPASQQDAGSSEQAHARNHPPSAAPSDMNFASSQFADQNQAGTAVQTSHPQSNELDGHMPQLSIADLQRMLLERERTERIQNMQTALLKQQLDQLSRLQQQQQQQQMQPQQPQHQHHPQHQQQHGQNIQATGASSNIQLNLSGSAGQLSPSQQESLLMALQSAFAAGNNPSAHHNVLQATQYQQQQPPPPPPPQQQQQQGQNAWHQQQPPPPQQANGIQGQAGAAADQSNVLAQYGLITPMGSGPFNSSACPPAPANFMSPLTIQPNSQPGSVGVEHRSGPDYLSNYTPLESPAVTPASVFSTGSTGIVMSELFSPLTSPALGPQPPSFGEMMLPPAQLHQTHHQHASQPPGLHGSPAVNAVSNNFTPTASPLALIAKGSSKIRKNRSTTAEARANKVRPSPKPVAGASLKKKKENAASLASPSTGTPLANGNGSVNGGASGSSSRRASITAAPEAAAASGSHSRHQSADVAQSEGTSSTPSPIDLSGGGAMLPPSGPTNKILTPSSIMGIRSSPGSADQRQASSPNSRAGTGTGTGTGTGSGAPLSSALKGKIRDDLQQQHQTIMMQQPPLPTPGGMAGQHVYPNIAPFAPSTTSSGPKVTFNLAPQMGGMPIQPGALSHMQRDAWLTYKSAGGLESRRTSHKAAEQKRRDSLKFCFDELRGLLPAITLDEDAPNGSLLGPDGAEEDREAEHFDPADVGDPDMARSANKAISKVALLRHSNEYLVRMKKRLERREMALSVCRKEVEQLRQKLDLPPSDDPSITGKGPPLGWTDDTMMDFELNMDDEQAKLDMAKHDMDQTA